MAGSEVTATAHVLKLLKQRHQLAEQGNVHRKKLFTKVQGSVTSHYQMLR